MPTNTNLTSSARDSSNLLAPVIIRLNAKRQNALPAVLPWGTSLSGMTVTEFLEDYRRHLSFVMDHLRVQTGGTASESEATLEYMLALAAKKVKSEASLSMGQSRRLQKQIKTLKRKYLEEIDENQAEAEETLEAVEEAEEEGDAVAAVVILLLWLIFF